jgi:hypothetical protein
MALYLPLLPPPVPAAAPTLLQPAINIVARDHFRERAV